MEGFSYYVAAELVVANNSTMGSLPDGEQVKLILLAVTAEALVATPEVLLEFQDVTGQILKVI